MDGREGRTFLYGLAREKREASMEQVVVEVWYGKVTTGQSLKEFLDGVEHRYRVIYLQNEFYKLDEVSRDSYGDSAQSLTQFQKCWLMVDAPLKVRLVCNV